MNLIAYFSVSVLAAVSAGAQGTFQNLSFEQANPISAGDANAPWFVTAGSALPFWSVYYSGVQQTQVSYNGISTGATEVDLVNATGQFVQSIDGNYSVVLQGIVPGSMASISQSGIIPSGTQSLLFEASTYYGPQGQLDLFLGAQSIPFIEVGTGANYTLYGANISAWSGMMEQLTFLAPGGSYNNWEIDDITFSPTAVTPEPNALALMLIGGAAFATHRWRANHS